MPPFPKLRKAAFLMVGLLLLGSCSRGPALKHNDPLAVELQNLRQHGGTRLLRDITGGDWDSVHIFDSPVTRNYAEKKTGTSIPMEDSFLSTGNLIVYLSKNKLVKAEYLTPNLLPAGVYTQGARLNAEGHPSLIRIVDDNISEI